MLVGTCPCQILWGARARNQYGCIGESASMTSRDLPNSVCTGSAFVPRKEHSSNRVAVVGNTSTGLARITAPRAFWTERVESTFKVVASTQSLKIHTHAFTAESIGDLLLLRLDLSYPIVFVDLVRKDYLDALS